HTRGVAVVFGATDASDGVCVEHLDLERARRGAIVRAGRGADADGRWLRADDLVHRRPRLCYSAGCSLFLLRAFSLARRHMPPTTSTRIAPVRAANSVM